MKADGVLGLSPIGADSLLQDLVNDRQIKHKVFSFSLENNSFTLGGFDAQKFNQENTLIFWLNITALSDN